MGQRTRESQGVEALESSCSLELQGNGDIDEIEEKYW